MPHGHSMHMFASASNVTTACSAGSHMLKCTFFLLALMIAGCGGPVIDASTGQSMQASIEHIRSTLNTEDNAAFDKALIDLNDMLFNRTDAVSQATISMYRPDALLRKILHGKTARNVIDMVEEHRKKLTGSSPSDHMTARLIQALLTFCRSRALTRTKAFF